MVNIVFAHRTLGRRLCRLLLLLRAHNLNKVPPFFLFLQVAIAFTFLYSYYNTFLDDKKLCFRDFVRVVK